MIRDGFTCQKCQAPAWGRGAVVDHIVPKSKGGTDEMGNLRTLCWSCHSKREGWRAYNEAKKAAKGALTRLHM